MSYGDFLVWLENELNIDDDGEFDTLQSRLADYYRRVSGLSKESAESRAEANVHTLGRFNFPVHACGYNWLQSNSDSAATLARRVSEIIAGYRRARMTCDKAILVTHSMGGLVARYYSEVVGGQDDLLGIVHGVMPTTGAPVFYRRMKSGTASDPLVSLPGQPARYWATAPEDNGSQFMQFRLGVAVAIIESYALYQTLSKQDKDARDYTKMAGAFVLVASAIADTAASSINMVMVMGKYHATDVGKAAQFRLGGFSFWGGCWRRWGRCLVRLMMVVKLKLR
ncbi:esterase/lipase family protein [Chromohalobacter israelensis]|uniref:esterase/lipase family protein n=1 Tax=Chromohalobacter israelensis TaxID=141390 RepID=UPI00265BA92C|nr:hypothetical protein [Chromohalobacter salexigens]MDO0944137.1 hypothetical protein [Chromohalobacter salexigens]